MSSIQFDGETSPLFSGRSESNGKFRCPSYLKFGDVSVVVTLVAVALITFVVLQNKQKVGDVLDAQAEITRLLEEIKNYQDDHQTSFAVPHVPTVANQERRGTCWDFASIALLEHQYRLQGIKNGWLKENQFVKFNEQTYGKSIVNACKKNVKLCYLPGDQVAFNSTAGGEIHLLYEFRKELSKQILPTSVCPYTIETLEMDCPKFEQALKTNPISFQINSFATYYDVDRIKSAIRRANHSFGWSSTVNGAEFVTPCPSAESGKPIPDECNPDNCSPCPLDKAYPSKCCIFKRVSGWNVNGEFFKHHYIEVLGGHAMLLVGYNDNYVSRYGYTTNYQGQKGAFIIRNSWGATGHSIPYFMNEISEADERYLCPNPQNPLNWFAVNTDPKSLWYPYSDSATETAKWLIQPMNLICQTNSTIGCIKCNDTCTHEYFLLNITESGDDLHTAWFAEYDIESKEHIRDLSAGPMYLDLLMRELQPSKNQLKITGQNDPDYCGFYVFPYDLALESRAQFGNFFMNDFDIVFHESSYAANAHKYPDLDYSYIKQSTVTQKTAPKFVSPYPNSFEHHEDL